MNVIDMLFLEGYDVVSAFGRSYLSKSFLVLIKKIKNSNLTEGSLVCPGTKQWYYYNLLLCVCKYDDETITKEKLFHNWVDKVSKVQKALV